MKFNVVCGMKYLMRNSESQTCVMEFTAYSNKHEFVIRKGLMIFSDSKNEFDVLRPLIQRDTAVVVKGKLNSDKNIVVKKVLNQKVKDERILTFLDKQKTPRDFSDNRFGKVIEDMRFRSFETKVAYRSKFITLGLDDKESLVHAHKIKDFEKYIDEASDFAAKELIELGNSWSLDAWLNDGNSSETYVDLTVESFSQRIEATSIHFSQDGSGMIYFNDDDIFWGHCIVVYFSNECFTNAQMEG